MATYIDTHAHNSDEAFSGCEDEIISKSVSAGVVMMLQPDIDSKERGRMLSLVERHPDRLRAMLGLYPGSVDDRWKEEIDAILPLRSPRIVALGEIGLDYHEGKVFRKEQMEAFRTQLELSSEWDLPVNIHLRDATEDFFDILEDCRHLHLRGNLHAFGGSYETFCRLQRLGDWYVGIGGVVTFKNSLVGKDISRIPLDRIVLETDAPYLAPTPYRGTRNDSSNLPIIARFIANRKSISEEEVASATTYNAKQLFAL
ncbi:MAG TPA: hydrolase TatD [Rikenellaceae bacterium]|nr:hydrolase TatD [Rikenellaceae bacterium]